MLQDVEYFDFNQVDETKDYYHVQESKTGEMTGRAESSNGNYIRNCFKLTQKKRNFSCFVTLVIKGTLCC